jgi:hypothetical protein
LIQDLSGYAGWLLFFLSLLLSSIEVDGVSSFSRYPLEYFSFP